MYLLKSPCTSLNMALASKGINISALIRISSSGRGTSSRKTLSSPPPPKEREGKKDMQRQGEDEEHLIF